MYVTPKQKRNLITRTILLIVGIPLVVYAGYLATQLISNAGGDATPQEVIKSNRTSTSVTISWLTNDDSVGSVTVFEGDQEIGNFADSRGSDSRKTHYVEVVNLDPDTEYTYKIVSDGQEYKTAESTPLTFKTYANDEDLPVPTPVLGDAESEDLIVFIGIADDSILPISTTPNSVGSWYIDLSTLKNEDGTNYGEVDPTLPLKVLLQSPNGGAMVEGTYGELFDESGFFTGEFQISESTIVSDNLPDGATIGDLIASNPDPVDPDPVDPDPVDPDPVDPDPVDPDPVDPDPVDPDPVDPDPVDPPSTFDPSTRQFKIATDVTWKNLVTATGGSTATPDVVTGAASVQVLGLNDTAFQIAWISSTPVQGYVNYGVDPTSLSDEAIDARDSVITKASYHVHIIEVNNLSPETTYYYEIVSGTETYNDDGSPFSVTTFSTLSSPPPYSSVNGTIAGDVDYTDAIIKLTLTDQDEDGSLGTSWSGAALPDTNGGWTASIGDLRTQDGAEYFELTTGDKVTAELFAYAESVPVDVSANALETTSIDLTGTGGTSSGTTYTRVPLLTLADYQLNGAVVASTGTGGSVTTGSTGGTTYTGTTPNTAISEPLLMSFGFGTSAIIGGVYLWFVGKGKRGGNQFKKKKMLSSI